MVSIVKKRERVLSTSPKTRIQNRRDKGLFAERYLHAPDYWHRDQQDHKVEEDTDKRGAMTGEGGVEVLLNRMAECEEGNLMR